MRQQRLVRDKPEFLRAVEDWLAAVTSIVEQWHAQIQIFSTGAANARAASQFEQALQEGSDVWTLNEAAYGSLLSAGQIILMQLSRDPHATARWFEEGIKNFPGLLGSCQRIFRGTRKQDDSCDKQFVDAFVALLRFIRSAKYSDFEATSRLLLGIIESNRNLVEQLFSTKGGRNSGSHIDVTIFNQLRSTAQQTLSMVGCVQRAVAERERLKVALK